MIFLAFCNNINKISLLEQYDDFNFFTLLDDLKKILLLGDFKFFPNSKALKILDLDFWVAL